MSGQVEAEGGQRSQPRSLAEIAYRRLLSMLVTMQIRPGAHIGIEALAREMQISQTPIREALTQLEAQRLATKIPNVGFRAADLLTPAEVDALFELRLMIEPRAAALAAERRDPALMAALRGLAERMTAMAAGNENAYAQFAEDDAELHLLIAKASGNRFIAETVEGLHAHLHIFRFLFRTNSTTTALAEHATLIDALMAGDAAAAEAAMRAHVGGSHARVGEAIADGAQEARPHVARPPARRAPEAGRGSRRPVR